jgi:putative transport protein
VREFGYVLLLGGIVVMLAPLLAGLFFGRFVLKLNPVLLLGGIAGAQIMIAGVAGLQEKSDSSIFTLGYSYTAAIGRILLPTSGTLIAALMS